MDSVKHITGSMLGESEIIILMLVDSGMSYYDLGKRLACSASSIKRIHDKAKKKMNKLAEAGLLSTELKQS